MAAIVNLMRNAALVATLAAAAAATGCRTGEPKDVAADVKVAVEQLPPQIPGVSSWDALSADVRQEIFDGGYKRYPNLAMSERHPAAQYKGTPNAALTERMVGYMRNNGTMAVDDSTHGRIGDVEVTVTFLTL